MRKSRKFSKESVKREPRINERIRAPQVRLIYGEEEPVILKISLALAKAADLGLDLVEVSPNQVPPVCRIINYGKYKFEQKKRKQEQARNQHIITIKEIKLHPKIAKHDYDLKRRNASAFINGGDKVKVSIRFRGREIAHPELGMKLMKQMVEDLKEEAIVEFPARQEGRQIHMVLAPQKQAVKQVTKQSENKIKNKAEKKLSKLPDKQVEKKGTK